MKFFAAILMALGIMSGANATILQGRDITGKPVDEYDPTAVFLYDPVAKITWLRDANYAATQYSNSNGKEGYLYGEMNYATATRWASTLSVGGFSGWRLPSMLDTGNPGCDLSFYGTDCGYNVQRNEINPKLSPNPIGVTVYNEIAHLWYDVLEGNIAAVSPFGANQPEYGLYNTGPFLNMRNRFPYYVIGLEYALDQGCGWGIFMNEGYITPCLLKTNSYTTLAVRSGDVADVPVPATLALLSLGLAGIGAARRSTSPR